MRQTLFSFMIMFAVCSGSIYSQENAVILNQDQVSRVEQEEIKIKETIQMYFEGWMTGDTTKIGKAMHRTCQLKNIKNDDVIIYDRATYLGFFKPRAKRENAGGRVISINVTDDIAAAKCEIYTKDRLFTDYFNMMKLKDRWYIVDKIAMSKALIKE